MSDPSDAAASSATSSSIAPASASASASASATQTPSTRQAQQLSKLRDANAKYKSLLKMAKERIQAQEEELEKTRAEMTRLADELAEAKTKAESLAIGGSLQPSPLDAAASNGWPGGGGGGSGGYDSTVGESSAAIVKVCRRVKIEVDDDDVPNGSSSSSYAGVDDKRKKDGGAAEDDDDPTHEIWALIEFEPLSLDGDPVVPTAAGAPKRYKRWIKFHTEAALSDYIRRDTGEPVALPPYSLSPEQSKRIEKQSRESVERVTEDFRRFRVRAEVARKQADATVRALHSNNVQTTRKRIEGQDLESELAQARTDHAQLASLRAEMAEQETHWKQAYDVLLAENNALKSSGAEALLAAQWRQRYEACLQEKEDAVTNLAMEKEKNNTLSEQRKKADAGKYEMKYRDLKESFRLYRQKAKEIFEAQQRGETGFIPTLSDRGSEDAKIAYLKNLMVNYLASDAAVREHMETAIGTVLKFSAEDLAKIEKSKEDKGDTWF